MTLSSPAIRYNPYTVAQRLRISSTLYLSAVLAAKRSRAQALKPVKSDKWGLSNQTLTYVMAPF
jgi:hypothetical protein